MSALVQVWARSFRYALVTARPPTGASMVGGVRGMQAAADPTDPQTAEAKVEVDPKDRSKVIPVETSIKYLQSEAYQTTYGSDPVWKQYRRNFKGQFAPPKTRKTCIRANRISTGSPCPICRDEYLVLDYRNTALLAQFVSPHNGAILGYEKTQLCRQQHRQLVVAVQKAKDYGLLTHGVPFRKYDYNQYHPKS